MKQAPRPDEARPKRAKPGQACTSCRKSKARCDHNIQGFTILRCHRCAALNLQCSLVEQRNTTQGTHTAPSLAFQSESLLDRQRFPFLKQPLAETSSVVALAPQFSAPGPSIPPSPWSKDSEGDTERYNWERDSPLPTITNLLQRHLPLRDARLLQETSPEENLRNVLSSTQIEYLLNIFEADYTPWLNFRHSHPMTVGNDPLLDLVRCTVACRHLDPILLGTLGPRLEALTERDLAKRMFQPSVVVVQALMLRSLWPPLYRSASSTTEGVLLSASAANLASSLRLAEAASYASRLREERSRMADEVEWDNSGARENLVEATYNARLWICVSNFESMLCLGSDRKQISFLSQADEDFIEVASFKMERFGPRRPPSFATEYDVNSFTRQSSLDCARDVRLGIMARLISTIENGLALRLNSVAEFDTFFTEVNLTFFRMRTLTRITVPLPLITSHETPHFQLLLFYQHVCRHLMYNLAIREARKVLFSQSDPTAWFRSVHNGQPFVREWIAAAGVAAEEALVIFLALPAAVLATAPDIIFSMVAAVASSLVLVKTALWHSSRMHLAGYSEQVLDLVVTHLRSATLGTDYAITHCVEFVHSLLESWDKFTHKQDGRYSGRNPDLGQAMPHSPYSAVFESPSDSHFQPPFEAFLNEDFWETFNNLVAEQSQ